MYCQLYARTGVDLADHYFRVNSFFRIPSRRNKRGILLQLPLLFRPMSFRSCFDQSLDICELSLHILL